MKEATARDIGAYKSRAKSLVGILLVLLGLMVGRYFHLMVLRHEELGARSTRQLEKTEEIRAYRGSILDRRGRELALTRALPSVAVDPGVVEAEERRPLAEELAGILGVPPGKILAQLEKKTRFRWIRRQVADPEAALRLAEIDHPGLIVREELTRSCPADRTAAHLVGFTDVDGNGLSGVELAFECHLAPSPGERVVLRDGTARCRHVAASEPGSVRPSRDGCDVVLSLDLTIQSFAEEGLDRAVADWAPESAVAVVMDPRTGDVLALSSRPGFDPRDRKGVKPEQFRIRGVTDAFEVGSTMKPLMAAAALEHGVVSFHESFDCTTTGLWRYGPRRLHDHKALGTLRFPDVIVHSSNIGMAQMVLRLGLDRTWRHVKALGFGAKPGSGLPGEAKGTVRPRSKWTRAWTLPSVAMGHELAVTPLQFATAFSALVNGGMLYRPRIALRIGDREIGPQPLRQVFSAEVATGLIVPTLVRVVEEGTGKRSRIEGYRVGGKTGTAQVKDKFGTVTGYVSSFVGFAPAEDPQILAFVLLDKPTRTKGTPYGGKTAGPAVKEILSRCLRYLEVEPSTGEAEALALPEPVAVHPRPLRDVPAAPAAGPGTGSAPSRSYADIDRRQLEMRRRQGR